jgi:hypothetical protein
MKDLNIFISEKLKLDKNSEYKEKKVDDPTTWDEGDILVTSGGYNMVLIYFYKIIKKVGTKSFIVRQLKQKKVSGNGWQGECVPIENEFDQSEKEITVRINKYNSLKIEDHYARLWDGKPEHYDHLD